MISTRLSALALVAAVAFAGVAQAQPAIPEHHPDRAAMHEQMAQRHAMHIKAMHDALNIRPDQEGAFSAFASR